MKEKINSISIWKNGKERAPHKPLLILLALAKLRNKNQHTLQYSEVKDLLKKLLIEFGPSRRNYHPEYPFVRLKNDGIWHLSHTVEKDDISDGWLINNSVAGGFTDEVLSLLTGNDKLIQELAEIVLHNNSLKRFTWKPSVC